GLRDRGRGCRRLRGGSRRYQDCGCEECATKRTKHEQPPENKKQRARRCCGGLICFVLIWHRPTFEGPCGPTIIGAGGLNCRVRDGNGWCPAAMGARNLFPAAMASRSSKPIAGEAFNQSCIEKNFQCHEGVH